MTQIDNSRQWDLKPGELIERKALQERFGGRTQGGIGPSRKTPNVLIFSDPVSGEKHGYYDDWGPDGCYYYTGEGQFGDQRMASGNASILRHREEGRALRVFRGARGMVRYVGQFEVDRVAPWDETDAPESGGGPIRKVVVFRLRPLDIPAEVPRSRLETTSERQVDKVGIEEQWTEKFFVDPSREPYEGERREAKLVIDLRNRLRQIGHECSRLMIRPDGELKPLFTDLYDATSNLLVEAKGVTTREAIRMSIGQLADYSRFVPDARRVVLVPSRPRADLEALAESQGVISLWPTDEGYGSSDPELARNLNETGVR